MNLTKSFRDAVRERVHAEPAFRKSLLKEALALRHNGEEALGNAFLQNYLQNDRDI